MCSQPDKLGRFGRVGRSWRMSVVRGGISADPDVFSVGGGLGGRLGNLGCSELEIGRAHV